MLQFIIACETQISSLSKWPCLSAKKFYRGHKHGVIYVRMYGRAYMFVTTSLTCYYYYYVATRCQNNNSVFGTHVWETAGGGSTYQKKNT